MQGLPALGYTAENRKRMQGVPVWFPVGFPRGLSSKCRPGESSNKGRMQGVPVHRCPAPLSGLGERNRIIPADRIRSSSAQFCRSYRSFAEATCATCFTCSGDMSDPSARHALPHGCHVLEQLPA